MATEYYNAENSNVRQENFTVQNFKHKDHILWCGLLNKCQREALLS